MRNSYGFNGLTANRNFIKLEGVDISAFNIPKKDQSHYAHPANKIFSIYTFKRLRVKFFGVINGKKFYFDDLWGHMMKHLIELFNSFFLRWFYVGMSDNFSKESIFVPLHVPGDAALTIREPAYIDQLAFIRKLLVNNPDKLFYLKEHPARIGSVSAISIIKLLLDFSNVKLLDPSISVKEIVKCIDFCAVVNSKAGAEYLFQGGGAFVFGDVYYKNFQNARIPENYRLDFFELGKHYINDFEELRKMSFIGELYVEEPENLNRVKNAINSL